MVLKHPIMNANREELASIKEVLKANPRGMNVLEIAKAINMHRQSVAKYMEMLTISGQVDVKAFGPSKVYYLSQRLPISAILNISSDVIIKLDKNLMIMDVNDAFLKLIKAERDEILNKNIDSLPFIHQLDPAILSNIVEAINGKESVVETLYKNMDAEKFFNVKFIPSVFEDGQPGVIILFEDITDRKLMDMAIKANEKKLRGIIEQSFDGIMITDKHGIVIEYNRSLQQLTGVNKDDVLGKYIWDVLFHIMEAKDESVYRKIKLELKDLLKNDRETYKHHELEIVRPDKSKRTLQIITSLIRTENSYLLCSIARDVTERIQMEKALRERDEKLRVLIETMQTGLAIHQGERFIDVNNALEKMTGYSRDELLSMKFWDIVHPYYRDMVKEHILGVHQAEGQAPSTCECRIVTKNGDIRWVELNVGHVTYEGEQWNIISCVDAQSRKEVNDALKEKQINFNSAKHFSSFGSWKWDIKSNKMDLSDETYNILGIQRPKNSKDVLIDREKFLNVVHPDDRDKIANSAEAVLQKRGKQSERLRIIRPDGTERVIRVEEEAIFDKSGNPMAIYGVWHDVTEYNHLEEERDKLAARLKESADMLSAIVYATENAMSTPNLDEFLSSVLNRLVHLVKAKSIVLLLRDPDRIYVRAGVGVDDLVRARLSTPATKGFSCMITPTGEPLYIEDAQSEPRANNTVFKEIGVRSMLGVPVKHRGEVVGVLHVEWGDVHPYKKEEQDVLQVIADRCGAAIMNTMLYERTKKLMSQARYKVSKGF
ncbi:PAS domain S-box protein [Methanocella conradii]|uniref:PAS domain S-box protein n=1 Tax=Methanocella conradii TaxID=1175444 RepID=UPI0024B35246|nr:PAS domain S-box protein [Methanocella conradii]